MNDLHANDSHPFGLVNLWAQGDGITRTVALILLCMSIISWIIIVTKTLALWKIKDLPAQIVEFWQKPTMNEAINSLALRELNPFYDLAQTANLIVAERSKDGVPTAIQFNINQADWLALSLKNTLENSIQKLQNGLAFLASTGATAPFIGLFGTVWGIYHALMSIGLSGSASIDQVAGPIGEALIMTALGLAVAIPAVLAYNALNKSNRELLSQLRRVADDLHTYFRQPSGKAD